MSRTSAVRLLPVVLLAAALGSAACAGQGVRRTCVARSGCPAVAALPRCGSGAPAAALAELLAGAGARLGEVVRVEGPLRRGPGVCTLLACGSRACCNRCGADLAIGEPAAGLTLVDATAGPGARRLVCGGDETGLCCPVPTDGRTVVAEGRLRLHGRTVQGPRYALENPSLCVR